MKYDEDPTCPKCKAQNRFREKDNITTREIAGDLLECKCNKCQHKWTEVIEDDDEVDD